MNRRCALFALLALGALLLLATLVPVASAGSKPVLTLKAASTSVPVERPVKLTVTVTGSQPPYAVPILKKTKTGWVRVAMATLVAPGRYTAFVTFGTKGKRSLRAAFVTASGATLACSNTVTITVT